jgi:thiol:disulfide interchange protein
MVEAWSEALAAAIASSGWWAPLAALLGGLLTAANACVLASVPLLMGYVGGRPGDRSVGRSFALAVTFTVGLTTAFLIPFLTPGPRAPGCGHRGGPRWRRRSACWSVCTCSGS